MQGRVQTGKTGKPKVLGTPGVPFSLQTLLEEKERPEQPPNRIFTSSVPVTIGEAVIPHGVIEIPVISGVKSSV